MCACAHVFQKRHWRALIGACALNRANTVIFLKLWLLIQKGLADRFLMSIYNFLFLWKMDKNILQLSSKMHIVRSSGIACFFKTVLI